MAWKHFADFLQPVFPPNNVHLCGEIGESVAILSELYPSLIAPNTSDNHVAGMHKCEGMVAGICFNCCTIMIKQCV